MTDHTLHSRITEALERLLDASPKDHPFVVLKQFHEHRFVQFASDRKSPVLLLDLPVEQLDLDERARVDAWFRKRGTVIQLSMLRDTVTGEPAGRIWSFHVELEHDAEKGATAALDLIREVFLITEPELVIEEGCGD